MIWAAITKPLFKGITSQAGKCRGYVSCIIQVILETRHIGKMINLLTQYRSRPIPLNLDLAPPNLKPKLGIRPHVKGSLPHLWMPNFHICHPAGP